LAGADELRLASVELALSDNSVRALLCTRGGYGSMRILPRLKVPDFPKAVVGYSDVCAIHAVLQQRGWASIHGPLLSEFAQLPQESLDRLFCLLESDRPAEPLRGNSTYSPGTAEGPLLGGNLAVFTRLLGTPYFPDVSGAVLLLEDVEERPYRLDRMWTHLRLAGIFGRISGIALGDFVNCDEPDGSITAAEVLTSLAMETRLPCAAGFPIGHGPLKMSVPLGCRVRLDASAQQLEFLEAPATRSAR
jgi:muramoyltetrapeptide carboxypeptidase